MRCVFLVAVLFAFVGVAYALEPPTMSITALKSASYRFAVTAPNVDDGSAVTVSFAPLVDGSPRTAGACASRDASDATLWKEFFAKRQHDGTQWSVEADADTVVYVRQFSLAQLRDACIPTSNETRPVRAHDDGSHSIAGTVYVTLSAPVDVANEASGSYELAVHALPFQIVQLAGDGSAIVVGESDTVSVEVVSIVHHPDQPLTLVLETYSAGAIASHTPLIESTVDGVDLDEPTRCSHANPDGSSPEAVCHATWMYRVPGFGVPHAVHFTTDNGAVYTASVLASPPLSPASAKIDGEVSRFQAAAADLGAGADLLAVTVNARNDVDEGIEQRTYYDGERFDEDVSFADGTRIALQLNKRTVEANNGLVARVASVTVCTVLRAKDEGCSGKNAKHATHVARLDEQSGEYTFDKTRAYDVAVDAQAGTLAFTLRVRDDVKKAQRLDVRYTVARVHIANADYVSGGAALVSTYGGAEGDVDKNWTAEFKMTCQSATLQSHNRGKRLCLDLNGDADTERERRHLFPDDSSDAAHDWAYFFFVMFFVLFVCCGVGFCLYLIAADSYNWGGAPRTAVKHTHYSEMSTHPSLEWQGGQDGGYRFKQGQSTTTYMRS